MEDSDKSQEHIRKRSRGRPPLPKGLKCVKCGTTDTPEWRVGETGPHTLCNACGLQYAKKKKWEIESKAKHSLKNILNEGTDVDSEPPPLTPSPIHLPAVQQQSILPLQQLSPIQQISPMQTTATAAVPIQIQPPISHSPVPYSPLQTHLLQPSQPFQPTSYQSPSPFQQAYQHQQQSQKSDNPQQWVYSKDHGNKMQAERHIQHLLRHSNPVNIQPGQTPPPTTHSLLTPQHNNTYMSYLTSSSSSSSSPSSFTFSPLSLSLSSLSSSSSGDASPLTPHGPFR